MFYNIVIKNICNFAVSFSWYKILRLTQWIGCRDDNQFFYVPARALVHLNL